MKISERPFSPSSALKLMKQGAHPVLARLMASRGAGAAQDFQAGLNQLIPYGQLKGIDQASLALADAVQGGKRIVVIADYDADGATACSVAVLALKAFGANVSYLIPNRIEHGYGLTPEIANLAASQSPKPDLIVTVDNGIASHAGVNACNQAGMPVIVTDHHLPAETQPDALCIVNPNQHGCSFPSKALAGVGVIYYVMWALEDELKKRNHPFKIEDFSVTTLLPIVAVGTVADVVALDANNRILVREGLKRIRNNQSLPGIDALAKHSGKNPRTLTTSDIAFGIGPRINAAGRLETMDAGVECLTTDSVARAEVLAQTLTDINNKRKEIELDMTDDAIKQLLSDVKVERYTVVLHSPMWHQGVIGIVAGRLKERVWRPTFVLADGKNGELKGSGRSIPGFHLRDALDRVDKKGPGVMAKFGGHSMAAGVTLNPGMLGKFQELFEEVAREMLSPADLLQQIDVDGPLDASEMTLDTVSMLKEQVWGQAFPEPSFCDVFDVVEARPIGNGQHLRLTLSKNNVRFSAVKFRHVDGLPPSRVRAVYKLDANNFRNEETLQLLVDYLEPA